MEFGAWSLNLKLTSLIGRMTVVEEDACQRYHPGLLGQLAEHESLIGSIEAGDYMDLGLKTGSVTLIV